MKTITYNAALEELRQIVEELQGENIDIDELAAKVRRASELIALCREKLRTAEGDLNTLWEQDNGSYS